MSYEPPARILSRLKLGREEYCQRLVTTLIVGGTYPRWSSRSTPTPQGVEFLRRLDALSFGEAGRAAEVFVDELELAPRVDTEKGGAPDWAVIWPDRLWLIELKTEAGSHRREQLPYYFELGAHHFPGRPVDITYLTGPMAQPAPSVGEAQRYAHLGWRDVVPLAREVWGGPPDNPASAYVDALAAVVDGLGVTWREQRTALTSSHHASEPVERSLKPDQTVPTTLIRDDEPVADLDALIRATAEDGKQRAIPTDSASLEDVLALRQEAKDLIARTAPGSPERHVMPWLWSGTETTSGPAMTPGGAEHGYEVRLSRYAKPLS